MADLNSTLKSLGGNRLKVWLQNKDNQELLENATMEQKQYMLEKWSKAYEGAPFPFELSIDNGNAAPEASEAAPPPDAKKDPPPGEAGNTQAEEESLFGTGNIPKKRPAVLMTEQQRFVANLVASAAKDAPYIESITELKTALQMLVPKPIKRARPEYTYKWTSLDNLQADLVKFGGIWEMVTRANHPHLHENFFGDEGAVMWKNQSCLTFTRRAITQKIDQEILREFNLKADLATQNLDKSYSVGGGKESARLTITNQTPQDRVIGAEDITIHDPNITDAPNNPQEYYDYGDTGTDDM